MLILDVPYIILSVTFQIKFSQKPQAHEAFTHINTNTHSSSLETAHKTNVT